MLHDINNLESQKRRVSNNKNEMNSILVDSTVLLEV